MSEPRPTAKPPADEAALERAADELYGLHPDAFAAAREAHVRKARTDGQAALARELAKLRRPTQSAWLINRLWRDQPDVLEQLFDLAKDLRSAQAHASGPDMQRLTADRRELEAALMRRARTLAEQAGVSVSAAMEREAQETLTAALALPEVADEVRTGRLVKPAAYAGFGALLPEPAHAQTIERPPAAVTPLRTPRVDELQPRRAAQHARERRDAAEQRLQEARAALEAATTELLTREHAGDAARQAQRDARQRVDELQQLLRDNRQHIEALEQQLRDLQLQLRQGQHELRDHQQQLQELEGLSASAEQVARAAVRQHEQAQKARDTAQRAVQYAEHHLREFDD